MSVRNACEQLHCAGWLFGTISAIRSPIFLSLKHLRVNVRGLRQWFGKGRQAKVRVNEQSHPTRQEHCLGIFDRPKVVWIVEYWAI
jgi:hypothetical protein